MNLKQYSIVLNIKNIEKIPGAEELSAIGIYFKVWGSFQKNLTTQIDRHLY